MAFKIRNFTQIVCFIIFLFIILIKFNSDKTNKKLLKLHEPQRFLKNDTIAIESSIKKINNQVSYTKRNEYTSHRGIDLALMNNNPEVVPLSSIENDLLFREPIDIAFIFTNVKKKPTLKLNLRVTILSLLKSTSSPLRLNLITDEDGIDVASNIIKDLQEKEQLNSQHCKLVFVSATELANEVRPIVEILQDYFTSSHDAYYRDFLFFFSLFVHKLLPDISKLILMDIDIKIKGDIAELNSHFSRFTSTQVFGMSHELSTVYRHILSLYRNKHKKTLLGGPAREGGFPGYNSGVMLIMMDRMRTSSILASYLSRSTLEKKTKEYSFKGHLGDQDLYTLIALDHPEIFYTLPCSWNRQLCQWWRHVGYEDVFDQYFNCSEPIKIMHGNCKSQIPDNF